MQATDRYHAVVEAARPRRTPHPEAVRRVHEANARVDRIVEANERAAMRPLRQTDATIRERRTSRALPADYARARLERNMPEVNRIMRESGARPIRGYARPSEYSQRVTGRAKAARARNQSLLVN